MGGVGLVVAKEDLTMFRERGSAFVEHKDSLFENTQPGHSGYGLSSDSSRAYEFSYCDFIWQGIITLRKSARKYASLCPSQPNTLSLGA